MSGSTRVAAATAMVVGPALLVASGLAFATGGGMNADELGGALLVYAIVGMTVAAVGIARSLEARMPRTAAAALVLAVLGGAGGVGFGIDSIHAGIPGGQNLEPETSAAAGLALYLPGLLFPLGFLVLGVALWRSGERPRSAGPLLVAAAVLFPAGNVPDVPALAVAADVAFLVALAPLGASWLRSAEGALPGPAGSRAAVGAPRPAAG